MRYGEQYDALCELAALGKRVPQLDERPVLGQEFDILRKAYTDLTNEGTIRFSDFATWGDRFLVDEEQFEYVWEVLLKTLEVVASWKQKQKPSSSNSSNKTTAASKTGPEK